MSVDNFIRYWDTLNRALASAGKPALTYGVALKLYGVARKLYDGGETPPDALTFIKDGAGVRSCPAKNVAAFTGEWLRTLEDGSKTWVAVANGNGDPLVYNSPIDALNAAKWVRSNYRGGDDDTVTIIS